MTRAHPRRGMAATALLASVLATLVGAGGGCEIGIGGDVPAFECVQGPAVCPGNQVCDPSSHQCVAPCSVTNCSSGLECDTNTNLCVVADAGDDEASTVDSSMPDADAANAPEEAAPPVDTGTANETGPCRGLLCPCSGGAACDSTICADSSVVPTNLWNAAGQVSFCTQPCCTSADCGAGTVCYAAGGSPAAAGNYCINPLWVGRSAALGAQPGGGSCTTGRDCHSGLCVGSSCADPCCTTAGTNEPNECASGTTCRFAKFPGATAADTNFVAWCGQGGSGQNGSTCNNDSSCASELCNGSAGCADACRNTADCSAGESCAYVNPPAPNDSAVVAACFSGAGNAAQGSSCTTDGDCRSQFCDTTITHECSDVCFSNGDCKTGWRCRPATLVVGGGNFSVLACGP
jgi:hypothetical protein